MKKTLVMLSLVLSSTAMANTSYYVQFAMRSTQNLTKVDSDNYQFSSSAVEESSGTPSSILIYTKNPIVKLKKMMLTSDPIQFSLKVVSKNSIQLIDPVNGIVELVEAQITRSIFKIQSISTSSATKFKNNPVYEKLISDSFTEFIGNSNFKLKLLDVPFSGFPCEESKSGLKCTKLSVYNYEVIVE